MNVFNIKQQGISYIPYKIPSVKSSVFTWLLFLCLLRLFAAIFLLKKATAYIYIKPFFLLSWLP